ncbi:hypothetical protein SAMN05216350_106155 [Polaromonas sp. YR568]|uniref:hypothetical protein n=1 Tax=Polaromonas sp. YR568 TaxID=1855301 RepID=UPI0008F30978|nr:hypothetical protein [Polaromonas sp. YR568]SFU84802.1 hypothetical protein SAMN05216350_106155 [Polaromonas sp. YR568]
MTRRYFFTTAVTILVVTAIAGAYVAGIQVGRGQDREAFGQVLASVQTDQGFTKLQRLREFESELSRGCAKETLAKLRIDIQIQLDVLASFYQEHKGTWVMDDLAKRDPAILEQLKTFKPQQNFWTEPKCTL